MNSNSNENLKSLKYHFTEERLDSQGYRIGMREFKKDEQILNHSIFLKERIKNPEYVKEKTEYYLQKFKKLFGDTYDYSKFIFKKSHSETIVICKKHGAFKVTPYIHSVGRGCPKCSKEQSVIKQRQTIWNRLLKKFYKQHGDKYDYSKSVYKHHLSKIIIICKIHGEFKQSTIDHSRGRGCAKCGVEIVSASKRKYDLDLVKKLYQSGATEKDIVKKTGIKLQTFRTYKSKGKLVTIPTP